MSTAFLLIHGFTGTHYEMEPLAKHLRKSEFHVENIVLPGHETTVQDLADKKWKELTDYAQQHLDTLKKNHERVYVVGLSMGGAITLYLGANNSDLAGIIPLAAPVFSPDWRMVFLAYIPFLHLLYPVHGNEEKGWEDMEELKSHQSYGSYPIKFIGQLYQLIRTSRKKLKEITVPTLIVYSKNDPSIPLKHAKKIYDDIKSERKKIVQIMKGGHVIPKDAGRHQLFEEIDSWIIEN
jgi:carboxylesterase